MLLHELIKRFNSSIPLGQLPNPYVTGIVEDSRRVVSGSVFVARTGSKAVGTAFVADAAARGAIAVVTEVPIAESPLPEIRVADAGAALSILANLFHGDPSRCVKVLGITGTNGKTTTTYIVRHLLANRNLKCGLIGTVEIDDGQRSAEASMTTPSAADVAALLAAMRDNGCAACAIETSSHALDQGRVAGVTFAAAGFTNLTGDHLDYHKTMDHYAASKARLFDALPTEAVAVVNADDAAAGRMVAGTRARVVRYSTQVGVAADYRAIDIQIASAGTRFILETPHGSVPVNMRLIGRHNVENVLLSAALIAETFGLSPAEIADGLSDALGAPGRLQPVQSGQPFAVLVDYAHTDDALENVLSALKPLTTGKLRVIFGCGGDRDRTKRPRMAKTAQTYADAIYVTSDNPRTENPDSILKEIVTGFTAVKPVYVEVDRRTAIQKAIADAGPEDVVLIAGKGHENYQIIGTIKHHFDDVEEATRCLAHRVPATA